MFLKNTQIRSKTKLKLQFCRSRLKNEQNRRTLFDVGICKILIKSQFLSLVIIKTLVLVSDSTLFPNTRSFTYTILHLKSKVINVLDKIWFIKTNLQQKMFHFQPNFFFISSIFANRYIKNAEFTLSHQYILFVTKVKQQSHFDMVVLPQLCHTFSEKLFLRTPLKGLLLLLVKD